MSTTIGTSNNSAAYKPQVSAAGNSAGSSQQRLGNLFQQIDTSGSGRISKVQFEQAFDKLSLPSSIKEMGKETVYTKLDPNGTGTVTKQEFIQGLVPLMNQKASASKETAIEAKPAPTAKTPEKTAVPQSLPSNMSPQSEGWAVGYIIDTTA